jgi:hypothetical protein
MKTHDIIVVGDIHGDFGALNSLINKGQPQIVLQCGDFGYWPLFVQPDRYGNIATPKAGNCRVHWCDGNHEDHWRLRDRRTDELWPNVFYQPRGSTLTLPDGRVVLFMGGADSYDKNTRLLGKDWFPEEVISFDDINKLDPKMHVDIVVSHTCPSKYMEHFMYDTTSLTPDPSRHALSAIKDMYSPSLWYFAHWHRYRVKYLDGCKFTALNYPGNCGRWWVPLEPK